MSPDLPVQLGDVATWLQAGGGFAQLPQAIWAERIRRAERFRDHLEQQSGLSESALRAAVVTNERVAEVVASALEGAMTIAAEEKRQLLARVVAAAVEDDALVDEVAVLLRTVLALEPYHIRLLVRIATPREGRGQLAGTEVAGSVAEEELYSAVGGGLEDLLGPMLGVLQREGLVDDAGSGTWDAPKAWSVTEYGRRLLGFVATP